MTARKVAQSTKDQSASTVEEPGTDITPSTVYDDQMLRSIISFDDAVAAATAVYGDVVDASKEIGDGFALLKSDQKSRLLGIPLIFLEWSFNPGDFGDTFVSARVIARNPDGSVSKYILNDGSGGICEDLKSYTQETGRNGGLMVRNGLRDSKYTYCSECRKAVNDGMDQEHRIAGFHGPAATYYIDTSA